jgi:hypothetical protein
MGVQQNLYLGYYFDIKPVTVKHTIVYDGCPKCKREMTTPFCSKCGSPLTEDLEKVKTYTSEVYEMCEELGRKWSEYIVSTDPMLGKNDNIAVLNDGGYLSDEDHFTLDLTNFEIPEMEDKTKQFIALFKERFGEDSIKVYYGLVNWFH